MEGNRKYFSVYIPPEDQAKSNDRCCVVNDLKEATGIFSRNPGARFRIASSLRDAWESLDEEFTSPVKATIETPVRPVVSNNATSVRRKSRLSLPAMNNNNNIKVNDLPLKKQVGEEKDTRFPTPKIQELTGMAREIRMKNNDAVIARIENNPKILINDCDRPTTVQEGCRYNALHVAATSNNSQIIAFILNKVSSKKFMMTLYPNKSADGINDQIRFVTDAYLNTPDKMFNETPLHFASKFMSVEATQVLVHHPWIKLDHVNKSDETAFDIIGSRADPKAAGFAENKRLLESALTEFYIIPVWRDSVGLRMPSVGPIAHIRNLGSQIPMSFLKEFSDFDVDLLGPCNAECAPSSKSTRVFDASSFEIKAFAGPTTKDKANELLMNIKWGRTGGAGDSPNGSLDHIGETSNRNFPYSPTKTTPRKRTSFSKSFSIVPSPLFNNSNLHITPPSSPAWGSSFSVQEDSKIQRLMDSEKGMERFCRNFSVSSGIPWNEDWDCLNFFGDIVSLEGLETLEKHLDRIEITESFYEEYSKKLSSKYLDESSDSHVSEVHSLTSFICNKFQTMELNSSGITTPPATPECWNRDCKIRGRYCTCIAPPILPTNFKDDVNIHKSDSTTSLESFFSAASESGSDDVFEDCPGKVHFIDGDEPGKKDFQIFEVVKDCEDEISSVNFPRVSQWVNAMKISGFCNYAERRAFDASFMKSDRKKSSLRDYPTLHSTPKRQLFK